MSTIKVTYQKDLTICDIKHNKETKHIEIETKRLENFKQDWSNISEQIKNLQNQIKQLKDNKADLIHDNLLTNILTRLYYETSISTSSICNLFGFPGPHWIRKSLPPYEFHFTCQNCQESFVAAEKADSRAKLERISQYFQSKLSSKTLCPDCLCLEKMKQENTYQRLEDLKNMPYTEYLQTEEWKSTRQQALKRACYHCQLCNSTSNLNVHHNNYKHLGEESPSDLIVLCRDCHQQFHH